MISIFSDNMCYTSYITLQISLSPRLPAPQKKFVGSGPPQSPEAHDIQMIFLIAIIAALTDAATEAYP